MALKYGYPRQCSCLEQASFSPKGKEAEKFPEKMMHSPVDRICIEHTKKLEELKKKNEEHRRLFLGIETKSNFAELSTYQLILQVKKLKSERNGWQKEAARLKRKLRSFLVTSQINEIKTITYASFYSMQKKNRNPKLEYCWQRKEPIKT